MKILSLDYGDARTGVAISDPTLFLASPLTTITERKSENLAKKAAQIARENGAGKIILGYPKNTDNTLGDRAKKTEQFKTLLQNELPDVEIILWDERYSTKSAVGIMNETNVRGKKRKEILDSVAATLILQSYLDWLR